MYYNSGMYYIVCLAVITANIVLSTFVLNLSYGGQRGHKLPKKMKWGYGLYWKLVWIYAYSIWQIVLQTVKVTSSMARSLPVENLLPQNVGSIINYLMLLMGSNPRGSTLNRELPVAVNDSQLRTMASETVDPIDWPLALTLHRAVPPELHVLHGVNAGHKSQDLLSPLGRQLATIGMADVPTAHSTLYWIPLPVAVCAATQGIIVHGQISNRP